MSRDAAIGWPNRISVARIALVGPFVACLLNLDADWVVDPRLTALAIFALMAASDGLDGLLARRLKQETQLGKFLDPLGDKLLITASVVLLAAVGVPNGGLIERLPLWIVLGIIGKDLLIIVGFAIASHLVGHLVIEPRPLGKACTLAQLLLVLSWLLKPDLPAIARSLPSVMIWIVAVLVVAASIDYVRLGLRIVAAAPGQHKEST